MTSPTDKYAGATSGPWRAEKTGSAVAILGADNSVVAHAPDVYSFEHRAAAVNVPLILAAPTLAAENAELRAALASTYEQLRLHGETNGEAEAALARKEPQS